MMKSVVKMESNIETNVAIILGLFDTGLSVAHLLADYGVKVIGIGTNPKFEIGIHSRCFPVEVAPAPQGRKDDLFRFLLSLRLRIINEYCGTEKIRPILFPCSDSYVYWIADNEDLLRDYFIFEQPGTDIISLFRDKGSQSILAEGSGLRIPKTIEIDQSSEMDEILEAITGEFKYPLFLKGASGALWSATYQVKGFQLKTRDELFNKLTEVLLTQKKVIVQETVTGPESNLFEFSALIINQKIISSIITQKIHQYPIGFGVGSLVQTTSHPEIERIAHEFIRINKLTGIINMEFKIDERDGLIRYIETNFRSWQQIELTRFQGGNFPLLQFQILSGQRPAEPINKVSCTTRDQFLWIDPANEAYALSILTSLSIGSIVKAILIYISTMKKASVISTLYRRDWWPFLFKIKFGLMYVICLKVFIKRIFHAICGTTHER